jgi:menaquinone-specific isochorismate synthase
MSKENHTVQLKKLIEQVEQISFSSLDLSDGTPYLIKRLDIPEEKKWTDIIKIALNNIDQGVLEKVVLARKAVFEFSSDLNSFELLSKLRSINPESVHYCLQVRTGHSFIGSSPEMLYTREARQIYSEAIAGTRARGENEIQDERLENDLLSSHKDIREHRFVMDSVRESLNQVCTEMRSSDEISVLKLAQVQHLYANYRGKLKKGVSDADLMAKLHPTPAVGGYPTEPSLSQIDKLEPFQRGWYASPIGWVDHDGAKFTIGIRSGLINKNILYLFSGSGIVNGSHPRLEWEEIENKIANFLHILNINGDSNKQYIPATLHDKY